MNPPPTNDPHVRDRAGDPTGATRAPTTAAARGPAPDFPADRVWLNVARPLSLKSDLRGKVVLLHFWTTSAIECVNRADDLRAIESEFAGRAVAVIGCHTARFKRESELDHVRAAVLRLDIRHPVVIDKGLDLWQRYGARAWPTVVVIAPDGTLVARVDGPDSRAALGDRIRTTLDQHAAKLDPRPLQLRLERDREPALELEFPARVIATEERLFIADTGHHRVLVTTRDGRFLTAFGSGLRGLADGDAATAKFASPHGLALDGASLLVADTGNHAIRAIDLLRGTVETLAGDGNCAKRAAGRSAAIAGGRARETSLSSPLDVAVHSGGQVLIAMAGTNQLWRLDRAADRIEPFAGTGEPLRLDGDFADSAFAEPTGLALEGRLLHVADSESSSIRALDLVLDQVGTIAGGGPDPRDLFHFGDEDGKGFGRRFQHPAAIAARAGVLLVADTYNHKLRSVDTVSGRVSTVAGTGAAGGQDGPAEEATFREPCGVAAASGLVYVADTGNHRIRVIDLDAQTVSTLRLRGVPIPRCALERATSAAVDPTPPDFAGTITHAATRVTVMPGTVLVRVSLALPPGAELVRDGPSRLRARRVHGAIDVDLAADPGNRVDPVLPVAVDGPGEFEVAALYYWRSRDGRTFLRAVRWPVEVRVDVAGADSIALADSLAADDFTG